MILFLAWFIGANVGSFLVAIGTKQESNSELQAAGMASNPTAISALNAGTRDPTTGQNHLAKIDPSKDKLESSKRKQSRIESVIIGAFLTIPIYVVLNRSVAFAYAKRRIDGE